MKRKFLLLLFIVITSSEIINAQIKKGTIFLGGQAGVMFNKWKDGNGNTESKNQFYSFSPAVGLFTKDNLVMGADLFIQGAKQHQEFSIPRKQFAAGIGVFARQYFPVVNRFYLYGQARFGANYIKDRFYNNSQAIDKGYTLGVYLTPGISFALKKNIYLETGLSNLAYLEFTHVKREIGTPVFETHKANGVQLGGSLNGTAYFTIGLRFLIDRSAG